MKDQNKADLKKFLLIKELMCELKTDPDAPMQYWHFVGTYNSGPARDASITRKEEIAEKFEAFIKANVPDAFDVASSWGPMSGFGIEGIVFAEDKALRTDKRFDPVNATELPGYADGKTCWLRRLTIKTEEGEALSAKVEQLLAEVQGPVEFSDFVLDGFGLHKAVGSNIVSGERVMIPPRVFDTPIGLFIAVPKERLYEMPAGFEVVGQSLVAFSQDVLAHFAQCDMGEATAYDLLNQGRSV
jgi:hypothetical protein